MLEDVKRWYAVHTRSRHEKAVAEQLCLRQLECFVPLREVLSQWKDRRKLVQFPVFPGYVFVRTRIEDSRLEIVKVKSVVRVLGFNGKPAPIPEEQIEAVRELVYSRLPFDPHPEILAGDRVRITRGPLRGMVGILVEKKNRYRFVLNIDLIQQAISCEVDADAVERL